MKKILALALCLVSGLSSAQVNLTTLPAGTTPNGTELILAQQPPSACNGCTVTLTVGQLAAYAISQLNSTKVISLWSGSCNSSTFLAGDGVCRTPPAIPSAANPTASVGLSAVNGSATTFMRSDAAPPLLQSISPTWTGNHTFTPVSGVAVNINGAASNFGEEITAAANEDGLVVFGSPTAGQSYGIAVVAGTTASDVALEVDNQAHNTAFFRVFGDGGATVGNPTGGDKGLGTINAQAVYVNGVNTLPKVTYGTITTFPTPACVVGSIPPASNIASCSNAGTGEWTVNIGSAYSVGATCTATVNSGTAYIVTNTSLGGSGTSFTGDTFSAGGTAGNFTMGIAILCMGS